MLECMRDVDAYMNAYAHADTCNVHMHEISYEINVREIFKKIVSRDSPRDSHIIFIDFCRDIDPKRETVCPSVQSVHSLSIYLLESLRIPKRILRNPRIPPQLLKSPVLGGEGW